MPATGTGTGIVFNDFDAPALEWALNRALDLYAQTEPWARWCRTAWRRTSPGRARGASTSRSTSGSLTALKLPCWSNGNRAQEALLRGDLAGEVVAASLGARSRGRASAGACRARLVVTFMSNSASPSAGTTKLAADSPVREFLPLHLQACSSMPCTGSARSFGFCTCMRTCRRCCHRSRPTICTSMTASCGRLKLRRQCAAAHEQRHERGGKRIMGAM